jgi:hypothetical protein
VAPNDILDPSMTVQIERRRAERRQADPKPDDDLSPEYLALLEVCGGEIRASDRAVLAERREAMQAESQALAEKKKEAAAQAALPAANRRRAETR